MVITQEEYDRMSIRFKRTIRTTDSEEYIIFSDDPDAGDEDIASSGSRVGHIIIQYFENNLSGTYISGTLLLEGNWNSTPARNLAKKFDRDIVDTIGAGNREQRESFNVQIYAGQWMEEITDGVTDDKERGLYGIHRRFDKTQNMVETLPEEFSETVEDVVGKQYDEIEDIIESDADEEDKRRQIRDQLTIGLERGLPTFLYENSVEERN
ncbi:hypothetical protein C448_15079 [Halococcus morrhuae DSM 1307]|uniref:Uncharacterized protein n=1 Tax=Halococcus morrhuae DSM 1307 TaxID=931277 RepID=M0M127_HALMO|nr:hypothetical protein [Halococcus morrhuae]EMA39391.1 hypothetical protein C448_15079 [Halococcus morrhuae DSM 1307]